MEVILDTSFILTCIKEKIDFLEAGEFGNLVLAIQVIDELKNLAEKGKAKERELSILALRIIEKNKNKFKIIKLERKHVDSGILSYAEAEKNKDIVVATLDKELKKELKGKSGILVIRGKKKLSLE